jgi:heme exporter protein D
MNLGPHAAFIIVSYILTAVVVIAMIGWVILDHAAQRRVLRDLEARGITRRARDGDE